MGAPNEDNTRGSGGYTRTRTPGVCVKKPPSTAGVTARTNAGGSATAPTFEGADDLRVYTNSARSKNPDDTRIAGAPSTTTISLQNTAI